MADFVHKDTMTEHEFVTSAQLDASAAVRTDVHGIYPANPIGFPDYRSCEGDTKCLSEGNPGFPQGVDFSVESDAFSIPHIFSIIEIASNLAALDDTDVHIPLKSIESLDYGHAGTYAAYVSGNIAAAVNRWRISFGNAGYEDYSVTGLVGTDDIHVNAAFYADGLTKLNLSIPGCVITGGVGSGRLDLILHAAAGAYVLLTAQDRVSENGLYIVRSKANGGWMRIASVGRVKGTRVDGSDDPSNSADPYYRVASLDNDETCGHIRHGYSDGEVADFVESRLHDVIDNAAHPLAFPGDLEGAGRLTKWFVECGRTDMGSAGKSGDPVIIDGFGLGGFYSGDCTYGSGCASERKPATDDIPVETPVTVFSIGTRSVPGSGESTDTLPKDWPFTTTGDYSHDDNNISLVKKDTKLRDSDVTVGGLTHDVRETCSTCNGTGIFEGDTCPRCSGSGQVIVAHVISNRIHVCVNGDFTPNADGTTTFKKTYIHLPSPIDTPDGDEYELTVSLPTVNVENAFPGADTKKDNSAYYEYMSQPRVVIMSGYWKFSDNRVSWNESAIVSERPYRTGKFDIAGPDITAFDGVPDNARIRFTLDGGLNCPRYSDMTGTLELNTDGHIIISELEGYKYGAQLRDTRMTICGIAYLDPGDDGADTHTDTLMGMHSRNPVTMGSDRGTGIAGKLGQYNKFVKPLDGTGSDDRYGITTGDARQVIATVYPTATNTFPWTMTGRSKMKNLDRLMTDEWDLGEHSISSMIWHANKKVIDFTDTVSFFGYGNGSYGFTADTMPLRYAVSRYGSGKSFIGSQLRIKIPENGDYHGTTSNPVRQARKAAEMLAKDFMKLRVYHGNKLPGITASSKIRYLDTPVTDSMYQIFHGTWVGQGTAEPSDEVKANSLAGLAWLSKTRNLPDYVLMSGQDMTVDGNSLIGANPFVDDSVRGRYSVNRYRESEFGTRNADEAIPCSAIIYGTNEAFGYRSVIAARVEADAEAMSHELYRDANRVAELQLTSVDHWDINMQYDITDPYGFMVSDDSYERWMDIYSATSNVFSIDTVPAPDDSAIPAVTDSERPIISGDPMATYVSMDRTYELLKIVASNLPFQDEGDQKSVALTNLLRSLVPAYGGKMPLRFWDGTRTAIAANGINNDLDSVVSFTRTKWPETECDMDPSVRSDIIDDTFISRSDNADALDVNIHYASMSENRMVRFHPNLSAPPLKIRKPWYSRVPFTGTGKFKGPSGYVRVYMKFKFSAKAGRWYTVDYMQTPMSYLAPLYGANALEAEIHGSRIWSESMCAPYGAWDDVITRPYSAYAPMDINPQAIQSLVMGLPPDNRIERENNTDLTESTVNMPRLEQPYLPIENNGIGLCAPCDANGGSASPDIIEHMPHANFWSVRKHLRPAVSVTEGMDIPGFARDTGGERVMGRTGGTMGDPVLWGQFDFPAKGSVEYIIPSGSGMYEVDKLVDSNGDYVVTDDGAHVEMR